jgi:uncharacterized protein (TIGR04255 family)
MKNDSSVSKLPQKISPCPIKEAIVEVRFESEIPSDAVFGIFYSEFKADYPTVDELPILQLPEFVRKQDKTLQHKPHYKLSNNDGFLFQVGPRVVSLISVAPYSGWSVFYERLKDIVKRIGTLEVVKSYIRIGVRYINHFEINVFDVVTLQVALTGHELNNYGTSIRSEIPAGAFKSTLQISNNVDIIGNEKTTKCSIIDIDTFIENPQEDVNVLIENGHLEEKKLFFTLLKPEFVESNLNPEY